MVLKNNIRPMLFDISTHVKTSWDMHTLIMGNKWKSGKQKFSKVDRYTLWNTRFKKGDYYMSWDKLGKTAGVVHILHGTRSQCFWDWELWNDAWLFEQREGFGLSVFTLPNKFFNSKSNFAFTVFSILQLPLLDMSDRGSLMVIMDVAFKSGLYKDQH